MLLFVLSAHAKEVQPDLRVKSFTRVELGAHLVVETETDGADDVSAVELSGSEMDRDGLVYTFSDTIGDGGVEVSSVDSFFDVFLDVELEVCDTPPCAWSFAGGDDRGSVEARNGADGTLEFRVTIQDDELIAELADKDDLKLSWESEDDHGNNLKPDSVRALWSSTVATEKDAATLALIAYDDKGDAADRLTETVSLGESADATIAQIELIELDSKAYALELIVDLSSGGDGTVTAASGDWKVQSDVPLQTETQFVVQGIGFEDDPDGQPYELILDVTRPDGVESFAVWVTPDLEELISDKGLAFGMDISASDSDEFPYSGDLFVALPGEVKSVAYSWGSHSGPEPVIEDDGEMELARVWQRHTVAFETQRTIKDDVWIRAAVQDGIGTELDAVEAEGPVGEIYASFGKGTKNTTSSATTKPQLF